MNNLQNSKYTVNNKCCSLNKRDISLNSNLSRRTLPTVSLPLNSNNRREWHYNLNRLGIFQISCHQDNKLHNWDRQDRFQLDYLLLLSLQIHCLSNNNNNPPLSLLIVPVRQISPPPNHNPSNPHSNNSNNNPPSNPHNNLPFNNLNPQASNPPPHNNKSTNKPPFLPPSPP